MLAMGALAPRCTSARRAVTILVLAGALLAACGASASEQASEQFATGVVSQSLGRFELFLERDVGDGTSAGHLWRVGLEVAGSFDASMVTHIGVFVCVDGDKPTGAVQFSHLHWEPERCEGGAPKLRQISRTPEEDRAFDAPVRAATPLDDDEAVLRKGAGA